MIVTVAIRIRPFLDGEFALGELVEQEVNGYNNEQNAKRHGRGLLLAGVGPVFIQLEADGLGVVGVEQRRHAQLVEAGNENEEPAGRDGGEDGTTKRGSLKSLFFEFVFSCEELC